MTDKTKQASLLLLIILHLNCQTGSGKALQTRSGKLPAAGDEIFEQEQAGPTGTKRMTDKTKQASLWLLIILHLNCQTGSGKALQTRSGKLPAAGDEIFEQEQAGPTGTKQMTDKTKQASLLLLIILHLNCQTGSGKALQTRSGKLPAAGDEIFEQEEQAGRPASNK